MKGSHGQARGFSILAAELFPLCLFPEVAPGHSVWAFLWFVKSPSFFPCSPGGQCVWLPWRCVPCVSLLPPQALPTQVVCPQPDCPMEQEGGPVERAGMALAGGHKHCVWAARVKWPVGGDAGACLWLQRWNGKEEEVPWTRVKWNSCWHLLEKLCGTKKARLCVPFQGSFRSKM